MFDLQGSNKDTIRTSPLPQVYFAELPGSISGIGACSRQSKENTYSFVGALAEISALSFILIELIIFSSNGWSFVFNCECRALFAASSAVSRYLDFGLMANQRRAVGNRILGCWDACDVLVGLKENNIIHQLADSR